MQSFTRSKTVSVQSGNLSIIQKLKLIGWKTRCWAPGLVLFTVILARLPVSATGSVTLAWNKCTNSCVTTQRLLWYKKRLLHQHALCRQIHQCHHFQPDPREPPTILRQQLLLRRAWKARFPPKRPPHNQQCGYLYRSNRQIQRHPGLGDCQCRRWRSQPLDGAIIPGFENLDNGCKGNKRTGQCFGGGGKSADAVLPPVESIERHKISRGQPNRQRHERSTSQRPRAIFVQPTPVTPATTGKSGVYGQTRKPASPRRFRPVRFSIINRPPKTSNESGAGSGTGVSRKASTAR